jgi:hypothetical protein
MRAVEASSRNEAVIQQAQNEVRSAQASIKFLEDELTKLQLSGGGQMGSPMREGSSSGSIAGSAGGRPGPGQGPGQGYQGYGGQGAMTPSRSGVSVGSGSQVTSPSPGRGNGMDRPLPPPPPGEAPAQPPAQKNYTQLGEFPGYTPRDAS